MYGQRTQLLSRFNCFVVVNQLTHPFRRQSRRVVRFVVRYISLSFLLFCCCNVLLLLSTSTEVMSLISSDMRCQSKISITIPAEIRHRPHKTVDGRYKVIG